MNVYLGHLSNCIQGSPASTTVRSILDDARTAGRRAPKYLAERTLAVRLPARTTEWLRQQAKAQTCAMAEVIRGCIAEQTISELTELYQQHTASPADFSAALWSVLGYEPGFSPGEEVRKST
ncbi:MAG: hypothetical protein ISS49_07790 [Anaerolineae bacterium]|nr:hypothetical protein [Anaerolineae bacterium]